jgi:CubicO group peptidase (beta-lactamase class C family)
MQFTAAAVLRLVDQGALTLGTHVSEVVPGITGGEKITIRDLLLQRSGLTDINGLADYSEVLPRHQTPASLVAKIKDRPLLFEPGSKYLHEEHSAYNLLALIVETKTGLSFAAAVRKLVFQPAGLAKPFIDEDAISSEADIAQGYQPEGVREIGPTQSIHWSAKAGNASAVISTEDAAKWVEAVFHSQLLKEASRSELLETSPRVGYGWMRAASDRYHETIYYMNGRAPGFSSFVMYLPKQNLKVIVFSNIYSSATTTIGNDLAAIALGLSYQAFQPAKSLPPEEIKRCTGTFLFGPDFYQPNAEVTLAGAGSELSLRWPSGEISPLIPVSADHFIDRAYWEDVALERDVAGSVRSILYDRFRGSAKP